MVLSCHKTTLPAVDAARKRKSSQREVELPSKKLSMREGVTNRRRRSSSSSRGVPSRFCAA